MHTDMRTCRKSYMHTCIHARIHACTHTRMHTCVHVHIMHTCAQIHYNTTQHNTLHHIIYREIWKYHTLVGNLSTHHAFNKRAPTCTTAILCQITTQTFVCYGRCIMCDILLYQTEEVASFIPESHLARHTQ